MHIRTAKRATPVLARARLAAEAATLVLAASVYFGVRVIVEGSAEPGDRNAGWILRLENVLNIDVEHSMQDLALDSGVLRMLGNFSYVWLHWPLLIVALIIVFTRDTARYLQLRNALMVSGGLGLIVFWLFPVSPPRFMPGFVGTVSPEARRHFLDIPISWSNQYAAFPSFHVGWTLIACLAVAATFTSRAARFTLMLPAALVAVSVVTTGNHYVSDATVGALLAFGAYTWFGRRSRQNVSETPEPPNLI